jgi:hypothetical protein
VAAWLFVLGEQRAIEWVVTNRTMAFRDHLPAHRVQKGDRFVLYVTRGAFHNPTRDRARVFATGTIIGVSLDEPVEVDEETFRQSVRLRWDAKPLRPQQGAEFSTLVRQLAFISKPDYWFAYVRKALVPITNADFETLAAAVDAARA